MKHDGIAFSVAALLAIFGSLNAYAHGGEQHGDAVYGHPGQAKDVTRTIKILASDYAFDPTVLNFAKGETIRFVVSNASKRMHELTIGDAETQMAHRKSMAQMADMKHDEGEHEMPNNAVHVKPGETRELIWTFTSSGELQFACNYPGHSDLGMEGKISVK
jgi:uncharacterized cupredoxin-like copper-binding protein